MKAEAAFKVAKQTGYGGIELMVSPSREIQNADYIKELIQKYQLPVTSVHAPTLLLCKFVWGTEPGHKLTKSVQFAEEIGATSVVVHPPFKNNPYSKKLISHANSLNADSSVDVAIENMFPWSFNGKSREMYGPTYEETAEQTTHLTFDFSHASLSGMNVMQFFANYHDKVRIIHLTDGSTRKNTRSDSIKDEHLLPGEGDMPIQEVYELLNRNNWQGETVLEINTRKHKTIAAKIPSFEKSLSYFNQVANTEEAFPEAA